MATRFSRISGRMFSCIVCCVWLAAAVSPAQDGASLPELEVVGDPVIAGTESTRFGATLTTVSRAQLESLNAQDLASALRRTPGVTMSRYNRIGSFGGGNGGAVFVRGVGSSRPGGEILTLQDGVPVLNPVWNHPLLDLNPLDPAQEIQVYKGPQPSEFGNGFSAVNLVPRRPLEEGIQTRFGLSYGDDETWVMTADHRGLCGRLDWGAGGGYRVSDGHRQDSDGRMGDGHLALGYQLDDHWRVGVFILRADNTATDPGERHDPSTKQGTYETRMWLGSVSLEHEHDCFSGYVKVYWNTGDGEWYDQAGSGSDVRDTLNDWDMGGLRMREDVVVWECGELRLGLDYDMLSGEALFITWDGDRSRFDDTRLRLTSPYVALSQTIGERTGWHVIPSAGVRWYEHGTFDSEASPHAGVVLGYGDTQVRASYARGISYPGLNVIVFSQNVVPFLGDSWEDLEAEKVDHWELGLEHTIMERVKLDFSVFYDEGEDRYVFYRAAGFGPPDTWSNIEDFRVRGFEGSATVYVLDDLSLFGGVTYLDSDPGDLPYNPEWTVAGGMNLRFLERFQLSVDAQHVGEMYVEPRVRKSGESNTETVGAHVLVNGKLSCELPAVRGVTGTVYVALENITDEDYEYLPGYPMPGISAMTGLEIRF